MGDESGNMTDCLQALLTVGYDAQVGCELNAPNLILIGWISMTREEFESTLRRLLRQEPFQPFVVELFDGDQILVDGPKLALGGGGATLLTKDDLIEFHCNQVRAIHLAMREATS